MAMAGLPAGVGRIALHARGGEAGQTAAGCSSLGWSQPKNADNLPAGSLTPTADEVLFSYMTPLSKRSRAGPGRCTLWFDGSAITKRASIRGGPVFRPCGREIA